MCVSVHCSTVYNSQDMEATKHPSTEAWINKEDVTHVYSGILRSHKEEWNSMVPLLQRLEGTGGPEHHGGFSLHHHVLVFGKAWTFGVRRAHRGRKGWKYDLVEPGTELESCFTHLLLLPFVASPFWVPRSPVCKILKLRTTSQSRVMKSSKMSGPVNTFDSSSAHLPG